MTAWLLERTRVLDGAMGSELLRRGVTEAATLWGVGALLARPAAVRGVHRDHAAAGAEALTAATFRVAPYSLRRLGLESQAEALAGLAVNLARQGAQDAGRAALVLASQTTLEDCYRPDLVPDLGTCEREHTATSSLLAAAAPDALLLETFNTMREAAAAARAATATGLPVIVSFTCAAGGVLLSGEPVREAVRAVAVPGVVAVGVNCTRSEDMLAALTETASASELPLVAYANDAWYDSESLFLEAEPSTPESFARLALAWAGAGARLIGGCCGTSPAHTAAIRALLDR